MAFKFVRTKGGIGRKLELVKLTDGQAMEVGDAIKTYSTGYGVFATASAPVLGIVDSFCDSMGLPLQADKVVAGTASGVDVLSLTTSSTYALVDCSQDTIYSVPFSGTIDTTGTSSSLRGGYIDVDSAGTKYGHVLETSHSRDVSASNAGDSRNFYNRGLDPTDSTRLLVSIAYSELNTQIKTD